MSLLSITVSVADAAILAVLGESIVFVGLIALMVVVFILGKAFTAKKAKKEEAAPAAPAVEAAPVVVEEVSSDLAPGSAGQLKLYDTPPKTAAMIMAIVADTMGKPLNELRFISIKEVKEK